jgi:predicted nucleic acid-binding protein
MTNKPAVYDTRFFAESYKSENEAERKKIRTEKARKKRYVSAVVIHELYNMSIAAEGREVAKTKVATVKQEFEVVPIDEQIAEVSAELRHKYHISMGDSMIAATALALKAVCVTDDQHIRKITEIETSWI